MAFLSKKGGFRALGGPKLTGLGLQPEIAASGNRPSCREFSSAALRIPPLALGLRDSIRTPNMAFALSKKMAI